MSPLEKQIKYKNLTEFERYKLHRQETSKMAMQHRERMIEQQKMKERQKKEEELREQLLKEFCEEVVKETEKALRETFK